MCIRDSYKTVLILRESREKALADRALLKRNIEDITHQIKTPLTTIQLMLDLIQEDDINQAEYIAPVSYTHLDVYKRQICRD